MVRPSKTSPRPTIIEYAPPSGDTRRLPWPVTRAATLTVCILLTAGLLFAYAGTSYMLVTYRLVLDGGAAILWAFSAAGIGWGIFSIVQPDRTETDAPASATLKFVTCFALGIGVMSLVILGLGLAGWLNRMTAIGLVGVGIVIDIIFMVRNHHSWPMGPWLAARADWHWLWAAIMPLLAIVLIGSMFPPGLLWGDEPNGYDVTEYHLQVPREWYEAGRIIPLHHNVFSYLPFNVEMHYLLAMHIRGGPWAGMYVAQFMHVAMCLGAIIAIYGIAGGGARGTIAAVLAASVPWPALLAPVAYDEGGFLLFGTLAIGWAMRATSWREFALAGIMAGFAAGVKLTAVPMLILAVPVAVLLAHAVFRRSDSHSTSFTNLFTGCAVFVIAALLVFSPWLIRNWIWTHNPVFPEAARWLGQAYFSDVQVQRWQIAHHLPDPAHRSFTGHLAELRDQVIVDPRFGYALLPLGIAAMVIAFRDRSARFLGFLFLVLLVFWTGFTHLQSRFFVLAIPVLALLVAQVRWPSASMVAAVAAVFMALVSTRNLHSRLLSPDPANHPKYLDMERKLVSQGGVGLLGRENLAGMTMFDPTRVKPEFSIDLIGDAQAFLYQVPMSRLAYKTVFDVDTSDPKKNIIEDWLEGMPRADAVPVPDYSELARFSRTYYAIPPLGLAASRPSD